LTSSLTQKFIYNKDFLKSVWPNADVFFISFCLDINEEDNDGLSALHVATAIEVVKYLIENGGQDISKGLHASVSAGELETFSTSLKTMQPLTQETSQDKHR